MFCRRNSRNLELLQPSMMESQLVPVLFKHLVRLPTKNPLQVEDECKKCVLNSCKKKGQGRLKSMWLNRYYTQAKISQVTSQICVRDIYIISS